MCNVPTCRRKAINLLPQELSFSSVPPVPFISVIIVLGRTILDPPACQARQSCQTRQTPESQAHNANLQSHSKYRKRHDWEYGATEIPQHCRSRMNRRAYRWVRRAIFYEQGRGWRNTRPAYAKNEQDAYYGHPVGFDLTIGGFLDKGGERGAEIGDRECVQGHPPYFKHTDAVVESRIDDDLKKNDDDL